MRYHIFRRQDDVLQYSTSSNTLGSGTAEIDIITAAHDLQTGDVIYIDDWWLQITGRGEEAGSPWITWEPVNMGPIQANNLLKGADNAE
jgi:hypothetical protein